MTSKELMELASKARENAYAPYSSFKVGAALLTKSGKVYLGCNIENAAYSPSVCAERVAIFKAVSEGEKDLEKIAIIGGKDKGEFTSPCGVCRQVMQEFCSDDFIIILGNVDKIEEYKLKDILPLSFSNKDLN